jgi:hypothetical protein
MQKYSDDLVDAIMEIWDECEAEISAKEEAERLGVEGPEVSGFSQQVNHHHKNQNCLIGVTHRFWMIIGLHL